MKKSIFSWMTIMLMAFVCVGFVACGSDDDDDDKGGGSSGGGSSAISLVGKNFYKSVTEVNGDGEKSVDRVYIKFKTSSSLTLQCSGYWELIYNDGSKDKETYDTGEMSGTYTISGNKVKIKAYSSKYSQSYDREETIVGGGLLGFSEYSD